MSFWEWLHRLFVPSQNNAYRPHLLRRQALVLFIGAILVAEGAMVLTILARQSGGNLLAAVIQSEIFSLTNNERTQAGVGVLTENALLDASAQAKANDMAAKGYFAHNSPDGTEPWTWIKNAGYEYQSAGENLAVRFVDSKDVMQAWMASPTHRANVVKGTYTEIGIGIAEGMYQGQPATFVVQHFGRPTTRVAAASTPVAQAPATSTPVKVLGAESEEVLTPSSAPAPAPKKVSPIVAVASAQPAPAGPTASFDDSLSRQLGRLVTEPRAATGWVLGGIAAVLMLALAFAFFNHLQVQAHDLLLPGVAVAGLALMLLVLNTRFLVSMPGEPQPAGAVLYDSGVVLTPEAAVDGE